MRAEARPYGPPDAPALGALFAACQEHYGAPPIPSAEIDRMLAEAAAPGGPEIVVAVQGEALVGFAVLVPIWPLGHGPALYLNELYIDAAARGAGAGRALMAAASRRAAAIGAVRLQWETSQPRAEGFYDGLGARRSGLVTYDVPAAELAAFAARAEAPR